MDDVRISSVKRKPLSRVVSVGGQHICAIVYVNAVDPSAPHLRPERCPFKWRPATFVSDVASRNGPRVIGIDQDEVRLIAWANVAATFDLKHVRYAVRHEVNGIFNRQ